MNWFYEVCYFLLKKRFVFFPTGINEWSLESDDDANCFKITAQ